MVSPIQSALGRLDLLPQYQQRDAKAKGLGGELSSLAAGDSLDLSSAVGAASDQDLLKSLGIDVSRLPEGLELRNFNVQFELSYQTLRAMSESGITEQQKLSFSYRATFDFLYTGYGETSPTAADAEAAESGDAEGAQETQAASPLDKLMAYFSPEKTAQRILDFALSYFPKSKQYQEQGDTETGRQSFADFIGQSVQKGFDKAQKILGKLPESIQSGIDTTHTIVFDGLSMFVQKGLDPDKSAADGLYATLQEQRAEILKKLQDAAQLLRSVYDPNGQLQEEPAASSVDEQA